MKKTICIIISLILFSFSFAEENIQEKVSSNIENNYKTTKAFSLGLSFDIGYGLLCSRTFSLGYVKKQEHREISFILLGNHTDYAKFGYLVYERTFHKKNSPLFYGYQIGGGYVKWKYRTLPVGGGSEEKVFKSFFPFVSTKFGFRFKIFNDTYLQISTEIIGLRYPMNIITITIK